MSPSQLLPRVLLAFGVLFAIFVPVVVAVVTGSLRIPHNDGWAYSRIAQDFGRHGHFHLLQWNRCALVGQIVPLGPFARYLVAQQLFTAALGVLAILSCYDLLAGVIGRNRAACAAVLLGLWPEFGLLTTSTMADVPALAAVLACLAVGRRGLASRSVPLLAASLLLGLWGVTIREQAIAAPAAIMVVLAVGYWKEAAYSLRSVLLLGAGFGAGFLAFELWRRSLAGDDPPASGTSKWASLPALVDDAFRGYVLLALAAAPVVFAFARPRYWRRQSWLVSAAVALGILLTWNTFGMSRLFLSDYLNPAGPYPPVLHGAHRLMLGTTAWTVLGLVAAASAVLLAGTLVERAGQLPLLLGVFVVCYAGGILLTRASGQPLFGRYLIVLLPGLLCAVMAEPGRLELIPPLPKPRVLVGALAAMVLMAGGTAVTLYGLAFDAARWHTGARLEARGIPAADIDAGFEWQGYHSPNGVEYTPSKTTPVSGYAPWFPNNRNCYVVSSDRLTVDGWVLVETTSYRKYVFAKRGTLYTYRIRSCTGW